MDLTFPLLVTISCTDHRSKWLMGIMWNISNAKIQLLYFTNFLRSFMYCFNQSHCTASIFDAHEYAHVHGSHSGWCLPIRGRCREQSFNQNCFRNNFLHGPIKQRQLLLAADNRRFIVDQNIKSEYYKNNVTTIFSWILFVPNFNYACCIW